MLCPLSEGVSYTWRANGPLQFETDLQASCFEQKYKEAVIQLL